ncbi:hypothetical protein FisN_19Lh070 [Fistulifera solaris]|uniref:Uncharacterized protein n=1 Tax=Fistulifera solaris TaxID=1519565 RepID=A0A1Z5JR28_FISSO|nr:hypothetical protein FisN_19Lh070 [Fistulifera solaris]|eukprot:GAX16490.1 hypothetical protein FisN_19Lh070 [Fistulifera solaris]
MTAALEVLNNPALVVSAGAAAVSVLPAFEQACLSGRIPWSVLKTSNALLFLLNLVATSRTGRLDGESTNLSKLPNPRVRPLVFPAGWAFAIWGPIFAGELMSSVGALFVKSRSRTALSLSKVWPAFMVAQICQILWTAAFRKKYMANTSTAFIAPLFLTMTAYALSRAHRAYSLSRPLSAGAYLLFGLPLSLHFGWMCAASLLNWNGSVYAVLFRNPRKKKEHEALAVAILRWLGHGSAILASVLGLICTFARQAPLFGAVISWALFACADTLQKWSVDKKLTVQKKDIDLQFQLCRLGAILSMVASVFTSGTVTANSLHAASP